MVPSDRSSNLLIISFLSRPLDLLPPFLSFLSLSPLCSSCPLGLYTEVCEKHLETILIVTDATSVKLNWIFCLSLKLPWGKMLSGYEVNLQHISSSSWAGMHHIYFFVWRHQWCQCWWHEAEWVQHGKPSTYIAQAKQQHGGQEL